MKCLECSQEVEQTPRKREKKFCDSTCRSNYWQKSKRKVAKNNEPENKKRIAKERNKVSEASKKAEYPLTEKESVTNPEPQRKDFADNWAYLTAKAEWKSKV